MANDCGGVHAQVDRYLEHTRYVLDMLAAGKITEQEAISLHSQYSCDVTTKMVDVFVARLLAISPTRVTSSALVAAQLDPGAEPHPRASAEGTSYVHSARTPSTDPDSDPSSADAQAAPCEQSHGPRYPLADPCVKLGGE